MKGRLNQIKNVFNIFYFPTLSYDSAFKKNLFDFVHLFKAFIYSLLIALKNFVFGEFLEKLDSMTLGIVQITDIRGLYFSLTYSNGPLDFLSEETHWFLRSAFTSTYFTIFKLISTSLLKPVCLNNVNRFFLIITCCLLSTTITLNLSYQYRLWPSVNSIFLCLFKYAESHKFR